MKKNMSCKNCMGCCIHSQHKEKTKKVEHKDSNGNVWMIGYEHDGYEHFCDKHPEVYNKWHKDHATETYETYKTSVLECYEPTESTKLLDEMINLANNCLQNKN